MFQSYDLFPNFVSSFQVNYYRKMSWKNCSFMIFFYKWNIINRYDLVPFINLSSWFGSTIRMEEWNENALKTYWARFNSNIDKYSAL